MRGRHGWLMVLALLALLGVTCRGGEDRPGYVVFSGMIDSIPYDSYDRNPLLPGGQTLLRPPEGTIHMHQSPFRYGKGPKEALRAGRELKNPVRPTDKNMARAKVLFETFCQVCHGPKGMGDGPIIGRFPNPPNLLAKHAKGLAVGNIYHLITHGQGKLMASYAIQVRPKDRWRLVHHVKLLQSPRPKGAAAKRSPRAGGGATKKPAVPTAPRGATKKPAVPAAPQPPESTAPAADRPGATPTKLPPAKAPPAVSPAGTRSGPVSEKAAATTSSSNPPPAPAGGTEGKEQSR